MSFSDQPNNGGRRIGCLLLGILLATANVLVLFVWYLNYLDLAGIQRSFGFVDLIVPVVWLASAVLLWLYVRFVMRDKN